MFISCTYNGMERHVNSERFENAASGANETLFWRHEITSDSVHVTDDDVRFCDKPAMRRSCQLFSLFSVSGGGGYVLRFSPRKKKHTHLSLLSLFYLFVFLKHVLTSFLANPERENKALRPWNQSFCFNCKYIQYREYQTYVFRKKHQTTVNLVLLRMNKTH